jgi:branched-chain amino acid transport system permease protein
MDISIFAILTQDGIASLPAFAIVAPMGPMIYPLASQPLAESLVLGFLIVAAAVHLVLLGVGLVTFGAAGLRTTPFSGAIFKLGALAVSGQKVNDTCLGLNKKAV